MKRLDLLTSGRIIPINNQILWHIENFTPDMDKFQVIFVFERLFKILQPYFNPAFTSTAHPEESQITLRFKNNGDAGLPEPFESTTLAYAYMANNTTSKGLASDIFFNDAETWTEMHTNTSVSLLKVAVHEALHACGLDHSDNPADILFWQYQNNNDIFLSPDTVAAIYSLYGTPTAPAPSLARYYRELFQTKKRLARLTEQQLVTMATQLSLYASVDDLKADTVDRLYNIIKNA